MANAINSLNYGNNVYTFTLPYGVCGTAADTAAKTVTVDNFSLETGVTVIVKFTYANNVASPTLNVNGTGAKAIMRYGTSAASTGTTTSGWIAGAVQMFTYDGTNWIRDYWNNTTYSNASLGSGYATCATAAATAAKVGTLSSYSLTTGGIVSVKFTYDVPASATLNINSKGAKNIYYRGAAITAGVIKAGDIATFIYSSQYHLIAIDRWQNDIKNAITGLSVSGQTITYTKGDGTTGTITTQDTNTTYTLGSFGVTATAAELNKLDGITATTAELNYCDGVTSNIQTQLDAKLSTSGTAAKATADASGNNIVNTYMTKANPTGTGALSINRKADTTVGSYSSAIGYNCTASGDACHAEGNDTTASGVYSHSEGDNTTASGGRSHAEGHYSEASGLGGHAEGYCTTASGNYSHTEGSHTIASGNYSHAEGEYTTARSKHQHVQGKYNIEDTDGVYAHIVGNGDSTTPSNAHTLDWSGNAWYAGGVSATSLTLNGIAQPIFTVGTSSAGYPSNPVAGQIHFMYEG